MIMSKTNECPSYSLKHQYQAYQNRMIFFIDHGAHAILSIHFDVLEKHLSKVFFFFVKIHGCYHEVLELKCFINISLQ